MAHTYIHTYMHAYMHACHAMPCHAMPCHAMPCHAMPCHAMPCHAMPCHAMPCHAYVRTYVHTYIHTAEKSKLQSTHTHNHIRADSLGKYGTRLIRALRHWFAAIASAAQAGSWCVSGAKNRASLSPKAPFEVLPKPCHLSRGRDISACYRNCHFGFLILCLGLVGTITIAHIKSFDSFGRVWGRMLIKTLLVDDTSQWMCQSRKRWSFICRSAAVCANVPIDERRVSRAIVLSPSQEPLVYFEPRAWVFCRFPGIDNITVAPLFCVAQLGYNGSPPVSSTRLRGSIRATCCSKTNSSGLLEYQPLNHCLRSPPDNSVQY